MTISSCLGTAYNRTSSALQDVQSKWSNLPNWQKGMVSLIGISTITALGLYFSNSRDLLKGFQEDDTCEHLQWVHDAANQLITNCMLKGGSPDISLNCESTGVQAGNLILKFACNGVSPDTF